MPLCLEIVRADGRIQREYLHDERTTVGSSDQASICVPNAPELDPLHILLVPREKGFWLSSARHVRTPVLLEGKPFESGQLSLGTEIDIGSLTLRVVAGPTGGRGKGLPMVIVLATVAAIAVPLLRGDPSAEVPRSNAPAPELFPKEQVECGAEGDAAERRGLRAAARARSKKLRYPFDAREGLAAVELYRAAAPCLAGSETADVVAVEEGRLRQRIEDDYQILRVHLERALGEEDWAAAMHATRQLLALLADRPCEYRDWLASLERFLDLHLSAAKEDESKKKKKKDGKP